MPDQNKKFCIGTSGATVDGRTIKPEWLTDAAESYDKTLYGARINMEHIRAYWPDSDFGSYGDVISLETRESKYGNIELWAELDPTIGLIELNHKRQKIYTSIEITENFAGTGKAYLTGLAITDSPASLGTTALQFSTKFPSIYHSESIELAMTDKKQEPETKRASEADAGVFAKMFTKMFGQKQDDLESVAKTQAALIETQKTELSFAARIIEKQSQQIEAISAKQSTQSGEFAEIRQAVEKLAAMPATEERTPHVGGGEGGYLPAEY